MLPLPLYAVGLVLSTDIGGWTSLCSVKRKDRYRLAGVAGTSSYGSLIGDVYAVRQHVASLTGCKITAILRAVREAIRD